MISCQYRNGSIFYEFVKSVQKSLKSWMVVSKKSGKVDEFGLWMVLLFIYFDIHPVKNVHF